MPPSALNWINATLYTGIIQVFVVQPQLVQNSATCTISPFRCGSGLSPLLRSSSIQHLFIYLCLFAFKSIHGLAPQYLCDIIHIKISLRGLCLLNRSYIVEGAPFLR